MNAALGFQWLGQGVGPTPQAQCCEQLQSQYPQLYASTLSDADQTDLVALLARVRAGTATAQDQTDLAVLQGACCDALRTTGTPQGATQSTLALQKQINQILAAHGCALQPTATSSRGEDGILGPTTCGALALISERQWGTIVAPDACSNFLLTEPTNCREIAAPAKKAGTSGALIAALVVVAVVGAIVVASSR